MSGTIASLASRARRARMPVTLGAIVLLLVGVAVWLAPDPQDDGALDPGSAAPSGGRAVARVLAAQGVDVTVARSSAALRAAVPDGTGPRTTIVVVQPSALGRATATDLLGLRASVVVVDAGPAALRLLAVEADPERRADDGPIGAGCSDSLVSGLELDVDDRLAYQGGRCFDTSLLRRTDLTLLGAGQALSNRDVLRGDNAALALRLLGGRERLVWYDPDPAEQGADDAVTLRSLLPPWLLPALALGTLAVVALVVVRARRLGPLVREPLPVSVRAAESVESLGRLYQRAGDRAHAAAALRSAGRRRWRSRLSVGPDVPDAALVDLVAAHLHRPAAEVADLLLDAPPHDDHALVTLAAALAALDEAGDL